MTRALGDTNLTSHDYLTTSLIADQTNFVSETDTQLIYPDISAEAKVIKKDCYNKLSEEAKEVIKVVTDRPISFLKFAWNNNPQYSSIQFDKPDRRIRKKSTKYFPYRLPRKNDNFLEDRLTNLNVIKLFFKYKWRKGSEFVDHVIEEITSFVEVI